jgi:hypothetical protein
MNYLPQISNFKQCQALERDVNAQVELALGGEARADEAALQASVLFHTLPNRMSCSLSTMA